MMDSKLYSLEAVFESDELEGILRLGQSLLGFSLLWIGR